MGSGDDDIDLAILDSDTELRSLRRRPVRLRKKSQKAVVECTTSTGLSEADLLFEQVMRRSRERREEAERVKDLLMQSEEQDAELEARLAVLKQKNENERDAEARDKVYGIESSSAHEYSIVENAQRSPSPMLVSFSSSAPGDLRDLAEGARTGALTTTLSEYLFAPVEANVFISDHIRSPADEEALCQLLFQLVATHCDPFVVYRSRQLLISILANSRRESSNLSPFERLDLIIDDCADEGRRSPWFPQARHFLAALHCSGVRDVAITSAAGGLPVHCRDVCGNLGHILYTLAACCDLNAPMYMPDITSLLLHLFAVMVDPRSCDIGEALKHCVYRLLDAAGRRKVEDTVIVDCVMSPNLSSSVANRAYILSEMPNSEYGSRIARHGALRVLHQVFIGNATPFQFHHRTSATESMLQMVKERDLYQVCRDNGVDIAAVVLLMQIIAFRGSRACPGTTPSSGSSKFQVLRQCWQGVLDSLSRCAILDESIARARDALQSSIKMAELLQRR
ncbi:hypothetical protein PBRA_000692 [Plasmodiophora brassicae]|uniref:Uncharacterized protein n=1 Tax=Plasmodiophora brassicae TaxID=37360 RepID=A0A0G4IQ59_PLABS|nr:hypothetical protein PBRA_000692 [Plasmodiophora brassicae]